MEIQIQPFGEISFENEIRLLGKQWEDYFFEHTHFAKASLNPETYLIVGRRGSGKSSLAEYFQHQDTYEDALSVNIGASENYNTELYDVAKKLEYSPEMATQKLVDLWEYLIWQIIFKKISSEFPKFKEGLDVEDDSPTLSNSIKIILKSILEKYAPNSGNIVDIATKKMADTKIKNLQSEAFLLFQNRPLFIVIDSREQYEVRNEYEMWITSALIQCTSEINVKHSHQGLHLKVCIADEIFPYLKERYATNTLKYVRDPLYMYWRPKDLVRLVCWRFHKYLKKNNFHTLRYSEINWDSYDDIYTKIWCPHFGEYLTNRRGVLERTLPYIIRHTQLRPRQLVLICNKMAKMAKERDEFPFFSEEIIRNAILSSEFDLADELLNSYGSVYPNAGDIISALQGLPIEFKASEIDRIAPRTASQWKEGDYSPYEFQKMIIELGIIGRKRGQTGKNSKIIQADFEFALRDRLFINEKDTCVIHPLFYSKLNINRNRPLDFCVYPFPSHPDFDMIYSVE